MAFVNCDTQNANTDTTTNVHPIFA